MIPLFSVPIDSAALLEFIRTGKLQLSGRTNPSHRREVCSVRLPDMPPVAPSWLGQDVKHSTQVVATRASNRRQAILAPGRQELIFPDCDSGSVLAYTKNGGSAGPASSSHDLAGPAC